jgi:hypothetical protein
VGLASAVMIASLRWAPSSLVKWFGWSLRGELLILGFLILILGRWRLGKKLNKYRSDQNAYLSYSAETDYRIAFWQKFMVLLICGILVPSVAVIITFGTQVLTRAPGVC